MIKYGRVRLGLGLGLGLGVVLGLVLGLVSGLGFDEVKLHPSCANFIV